LVLIIIAVIAAATFRDYGLGWDDYTHSQYGDLLLALYSSGFKDDRALSFVNLYKYGGGFDMLAALASKVLPFGLFETRRLVGAAIGIVGLIATWRIGRRLGGPIAGLIALVLLATCPLYYGHMFINAKDAPFATAMAVLLLGMVRALDEYPQPNPRTVALARRPARCVHRVRQSVRGGSERGRATSPHVVDECGRGVADLDARR
jgi:4-amino-4-deoxy-L-arabinose transferase-like glycosyltransferase